MKHQNMPVPPRSFQWGRNFRPLFAALALATTTLAAQELPPLPDAGDTDPRDPTPEELEAQRLAQEAVWRQNREVFAPFLHAAPAPAPEDLALKQRLISAELMERERRIEHVRLRDEKVRAWAAEQSEKNRLAAEEVRKRAAPEVIKEFERAGMRLDFRDGRLTAVVPMNEISQRSIGTWKAKTNAPPAYPLNANGQWVGMWEISVPGTNHVELNNGGVPRLIYIDNTGDSTNSRYHATAMAGTIAGFGFESGTEGMASSTTILANDQADDTDEIGPVANAYGIRLSNHSYGTALGWGLLPGNRIWYGGGSSDYHDLRFGSYLSAAAAFDHFAYLHQEYLSVWAAGNDRADVDFSGQSHRHNDGTTNLYTCNHASDAFYYYGHRTVTPESTAKNVITVGSILDLTNGWQSAATVTNSAFSNLGPTRDGRTKPDLVANGESVYSPSSDATGGDIYLTASGTSSAAAAVTGSLALLRERLAQFGITNPSAALLKALLLATADEADLAGPDYRTGFGVMNTATAAGVILTNGLYFNKGGGLLQSHFYEGVLTNGTTRQFTVLKDSPEILRAMLVWTDPSGYLAYGPTSPMLVNNLDVKIIHYGATNGAYYLDPANPLAAAARGTNQLDNAELAAWPDDFSSGAFTIEVSHQGTLADSGYLGNTINQPFALVVIGHQLEVVPEILSLAQTASNQVSLAWSGQLYRDYKVQHIDEVDAPATAWSDTTGNILMTNNPAAVTLTMPTNTPQRFYRVVPVL